MSAMVRARLLPCVSRRINKRSFSATVNTPNQQMSTSSAAFHEELPLPPSANAGVGIRFLKYGSIAAVAGIFAATGYATYGITDYYL